MTYVTATILTDRLVFPNKPLVYFGYSHIYIFCSHKSITSAFIQSPRSVTNWKHFYSRTSTFGFGYYYLWIWILLLMDCLPLNGKINMFITVRIFTAAFYISRAWDINSDTCEDLKSNELLLLKDCKAVLNSRNHLQASCGTYGFIERTSPFSVYSRDALEFTFGFESDQIINDMKGKICLKLANFTLQKYKVTPHRLQNYGTKFILMKEVEIVLGDIKQGRVHLNFEKRRTFAVAEAIGICNITSPDFKFSVFDEYQNTSCVLVLSAIYELMMTSIHIKKFPSTENGLLSIGRFLNKFYFLDKATITEIVFYINENVKELNMFFLKGYNILKLEFPENNFEIIKNYSFPLIDKLEVLNMTGSTIHLIEDHALDNLPGLKVADFSKNKLSTIPEPFYKSIFVNLTYLNLKGNRPTDGAFSLIPRSSLSASHLKVLRLSEISITQLDKGSFASFPHLQILYLDNCNLTFISEGTFDNLTSLVSLDLADNHLEILVNNVFEFLHSLRYLNLSNNQFKLIPLPSIRLAVNLTFLNIQNNFIEYISNFAHPRLRHLNVKNNRIKRFSNDSIDLSSLQELDLSSNSINFFTDEMQEILLNIDFVNLSSNPFDCKPCNVYHLHKWLNATNYRDSDLFICSLPIELSGEKVISLDSKFEDCLNYIADITIIIVVTVICIIFFILLFSFPIYYYRWDVLHFLFRLRITILRSKQKFEASHHYKYDAYISYCDSETEWVTEQLIPQLESDKYKLKLYVHERDFCPGIDTSENITDNFDKSNKMVALLSNNFERNKWCKYELNLAQGKLFDENRDTLILVKMEGVDENLISKHLCYLLKKKTYLTWPSVEDARPLFWDRLRDAIKKH